jgi:hypothetical protein
MTEVIKCPDCKVAMKEGFMTDFAFNRTIEVLWHPGKVESSTFLGIRQGAMEFDRTKFLPIVAFRCPECGLVRTYAIDGQ